MGQLTTRVVTDCVDYHAEQVSIQEHFQFLNYKLSEISLHINGQNQPISSYNCKFDTKAIVYAYTAGPFTDTGKAFKDEGIYITLSPAMRRTVST